MFRTALGFTLVTILMTGAALAQNVIDPQCSKMRDKIGCTCALQNGGHITIKNMWFSKRSGRAPTNEAFVQCQKRWPKR
jgi:hypothetical protein